MLPLRTRVDLEAMAIKNYFAFPNTPALLEPYHLIVLCHIQDTLWRSLTLLQRRSRCNLQPQPTGLFVGGVLHFCREAVSVFYTPPPADWAKKGLVNHRDVASISNTTFSEKSSSKLPVQSGYPSLTILTLGTQPFSQTGTTVQK